MYIIKSAAAKARSKALIDRRNRENGIRATKRTCARMNGDPRNEDATGNIEKNVPVKIKELVRKLINPLELI